MKLSFRQGIVSYQANALGQPQFLTTSATPGYVQLNVPQTPVVITFAHGTSDYLATFNQTVSTAWGPIPSPAAPAGSTYYLYWDMNHQTGVITYGYTLLLPVVGTVAPPAPALDQHWFDVAAAKMKVWRGDLWFEVIRVFAGTVPSGNISAVQMESKGVSWKNVLPVEGNPGYIETDIFNRPIYMPSWEFLTTDTPVRIKTTVGASGVLAAPVNAFVPVRAAENIPRMSLVYFSGANAVSLASGNPALDPPRTPIGIMQEELHFNEMGNVTFSGQITYDQWNWSADIGKALYCGENGQLTTIRPAGLQAYRVGFVKDAQTILFRVDSETLPQIYEASSVDVIVNGVSPIQSVFSMSPSNEALWTVSMPPATTGTAGHMTTTHTQTLELYGNQITAIELTLPQKAPLVHTHTFAEVPGLQPALDLKSDVDHLHTGVYSPVDHLHTGVYAPAIHTHTIVDVPGLQVELNAKASRVHVNTFDEVFDGVDRTGAVDLGTGETLREALLNKADEGHLHIIADTTGLVTQLAGKANVVHVHPIAEVTDLQAALDNKSNLGHTHTIVDIPPLQSALDGKVAKAGDTMSGALLAASGVQLAPGLAMAGNPRTGFWYNSSQPGQLQLTADGQHLVRFQGSDNLPLLSGMQVSGRVWAEMYGFGLQAPYPALLSPSASVIELLSTAATGLRITGTGLIQATAASYASLVVNPGDLTDKQYVDARVTAGVGALSLDGLTDVTITTPATDQVLRYNGAAWVNATLTLPTYFAGNLIDSDAFLTGTVAVRDIRIDQAAQLTNNVTIGAEPYVASPTSGGAGGSLTSGHSNVIIGNGAGASLTSGASNVIIGFLAGDELTADASRNVFIGEAAGCNAGPSVDNIFIGHAAGRQQALDNSSISGTFIVNNEALRPDPVKPYLFGNMTQGSSNLRLEGTFNIADDGNVKFKFAADDGSLGVDVLGDLNYGTPGQVLKSAGPGAQVFWGAATVAVPGANRQVLFSDGAGAMKVSDLRTADGVINAETASVLTVGFPTTGPVNAVIQPAGRVEGGAAQATMGSISLQAKDAVTNTLSTLAAVPAGDVYIRAGDSFFGDQAGGSVVITGGKGTNGDTGYTADSPGGCVIISAGKSDFSDSLGAPAVFIGGANGTGYSAPGGYLVINSYGAIGFTSADNVDLAPPNINELITTSISTNFGSQYQLLQSNGKSQRPEWVSPVFKPAPLEVINAANNALDIGKASDHNRHYRFTAPSAVVLTVRPDSGWTASDPPYWVPNSSAPMPVGGTILVGRAGTGTVTFVAGPGVTINTPDTLAIARQHGKATLTKVGPNEWDLEGNIGT